jgi:hypothetical protein
VAPQRRVELKARANNAMAVIYLNLVAADGRRL